MATEIINNIFLVNAPAGSGKTTTIRKMVEEHLYKKPQDNVLCITYTNRAAEELGKNIDSKNVFFGTIHSYINSFLKSYYAHKEIIELYWEEYGEIIAERIENKEQNQNIEESNQRYIDKFGALNIQVLREKIKRISYTEAPFNSLYFGGLGHDDLITFTRKVTERFPIVQKKIAEKFQLVFIDEYQDTSADVLRIFFNAMKNSSGVMYLLGDKMQQIYDNYDGSFEKEFSMMNQRGLSTNYRATPKLISILNKLYNDDVYIQKAYEGNLDDVMDYNPEVVFSSNVDSVIRSKQDDYPDILVLYLLNSKRFQDIGAEKLYNAVKIIDDYRFGGKYSVVEVLTTNDESNPDKLFLLLFLIGIVSELYKAKKYGMMLRFIKKNKKTFNYMKCMINHHDDKENVRKLLEYIVSCYDGNKTIRDTLLDINTIDFIDEERIGIVLRDSKYDQVLDVCMSEFRSLYDYLKIQNISTQHGVKGESHDSVLFVADDSTQPSVNLTGFFKLWSCSEISLKKLEKINYDYSNMINNIEAVSGVKVNKVTYNEHKKQLEEIIVEFGRLYADNDVFRILCKKDWDEYFKNNTLTNFNKVIKKTRIKSILMAYKLFYVGCSRARKNLTILVDSNKISSFSDSLENKFREVGFNVVFK